MTRICNYEGSQYKKEFWENSNRQYEDLAERIALQKMLPSNGQRLIEVGAGFGRTVDLYKNYQQIVLVDYARTQLEEAQRFLGNDDRFTFVVADVYNLPFVENLFDSLVMIRVMHHLVDVPTALKELHRILQPQGTAIIEHASKRHLKAILRWYLNQQSWNPFDPTPHEFVELNIDFHPTWMQQQFTQANFTIQNIRSLSYFRIPLLKKIIPANLLATIDSWLQPSGQLFQYSPSIFLKATPKKQNKTLATAFFKCPQCHSLQLEEQKNSLICTSCNKVWEVEDGIYNLRVS